MCPHSNDASRVPVFQGLRRMPGSLTAGRIKECNENQFRECRGLENIFNSALQKTS